MKHKYYIFFLVFLSTEVQSSAIRNEKNDKLVDFDKMIESLRQDLIHLKISNIELKSTSMSRKITEIEMLVKSWIDG